jgi:hypothetical protein
MKIRCHIKMARYNARKIALVIMVERPYQPNSKHAEMVYPEELELLEPPELPNKTPPPCRGAILVEYS